jgi:ABC-type transport system involved in cytochrome c biogenesis ATPase subunit
MRLGAAWRSYTRLHCPGMSWLHLSVAFGERVVVRGVGAQLERKTTLLRAIAGLIAPSSGTIRG